MVHYELKFKQCKETLLISFHTGNRTCINGPCYCMERSQSSLGFTDLLNGSSAGDELTPLQPPLTLNS